MFLCQKCGTCCRNIGGIEALRDFDNGNGECIHLIDNRCSIYSARPDICNVDKMYTMYYSQLLSREEYYRLNYRGCMEIRKEKFSGAD